MRSSAARTTGSGGWDDDWGDAFPAAPQTPAYQQPTTQPGAAFAYQQEAYPQQAWAPAPAPAPAPASGFMQTQQSAQQAQTPQFCGGSGGSSVMGLDQAALTGAAAQAMGVDPGAASAMGQVATGMAMNYLGTTATATTAVASSYLTQLRYYFDVNNAYVTQKLKVLALPFRHKEWERTVGAHGRLQPPALDVNAPDLYLPSMAYITYILVVGFVMGANGNPSPNPDPNPNPSPDPDPNPSPSPSPSPSPKPKPKPKPKPSPNPNPNPNPVPNQVALATLSGFGVCAYR